MTQEKRHSDTLSLEAYRNIYLKHRFLATPLTGAIAWLVVAVASQIFAPAVTVWVLFIATGSIAWIAMGISKLTGENFLDKENSSNPFNILFFHAMGSSLLVFAIAIPFFQLDYTSLPLSVGILTGTMWIPFSWIIKHPIGIIHAVSRTVLVLIAYYMFPDQRFLIIPLVIVAVYIVTIVVLELRWRKTNRSE